MSLTEIVLLILLAAAGWFWFDSLKAREHALSAVRSACSQAQLQLLDDTVALTQLGIRRQRTGRIGVFRVYRFEFSDTGDNRRDGVVYLVGDVLHGLQLDPHRLTQDG